MVILKAIGCVEYAGLTEGGCRSHGLRHKAMIEIRKLRTQLTNSGACEWCGVVVVMGIETWLVVLLVTTKTNEFQMKRYRIEPICILFQI